MKKSVQHGKLSLICFLQQHYYLKLPAKFLGKSHASKRRFPCSFSYFRSTFASSSTNSLFVVSPHLLKFVSSFSI